MKILAYLCIKNMIKECLYDGKKFNVVNEAHVAFVFSKYHDMLGFPKIVDIRTAFPDCTAINKDGKECLIEFEYKSRSFVYHNHDIKSIPVIDRQQIIGLSSAKNSIAEFMENEEKYAVEVIEKWHPSTLITFMLINEMKSIIRHLRNEDMDENKIQNRLFGNPKFKEEIKKNYPEYTKYLEMSLDELLREEPIEKTVDYIVCWENNWLDSPYNIIELKTKLEL